MISLNPAILERSPSLEERPTRQAWQPRLYIFFGKGNIYNVRQMICTTTQRAGAVKERSHCYRRARGKGAESLGPSTGRNMLSGSDNIHADLAAAKSKPRAEPLDLNWQLVSYSLVQKHSVLLIHDSQSLKCESQEYQPRTPLVRSLCNASRLPRVQVRPGRRPEI